MTQEGLSVDLKANAEGFIKAINDAIKSLNELGGTSQGASKSVKTVEDAMTRATGPTKAFAVSVESLSKSQLDIGGKLISTQKAVDSMAKGVTNANKAVGSAIPTLTNFGRVIQDAPFGIIGIANNIDPLISSFQALKASSGSTGSALKLLFSSLAGPAGIAIGISAVTSALIAFGPQIKAFLKGNQEGAAAAEAQAQAVKSLDDAIANFSTTAQAAAGKELTALRALIKGVEDVNLSQQQRIFYADELQKKYPAYLANFSKEEILAGNTGGAYERLSSAILLAARARAAQDVLAKISAQQLEIEEKKANLAAEAQEKINKARTGTRVIRGGGITGNVTQVTVTAEEKQAGARAELAAKTRELDIELKKLNQTASFYENIVEQGSAATADLGAKLPPATTATKEKEVATKELTVAQKENAAFLALNIVKEEANLTVLRATKEATDAAAEAQRKLNLERRAGQFGVGVADPQAAKQPVNTENLSAQAKEAAELADQQQRIADSTNNANAAFSLLSPIIDQTFNALANGEDAFKSIIQGVKKLIVELIKAVIQAAILAAILNVISPGSGSFGSTFKGLLGFKANGGGVGAGSPYIVGEAGPELFVPQSNGNIVPNMQLNNGGTLMARVSGNDLLFIMNQASGNKRRNFA